MLDCVTIAFLAISYSVYDDPMEITADLNRYAA
jgi:hypothetical protein